MFFPPIHRSLGSKPLGPVEAKSGDAGESALVEAICSKYKGVQCVRAPKGATLTLAKPEEATSF